MTNKLDFVAHLERYCALPRRDGTAFKYEGTRHQYRFADADHATLNCFTSTLYRHHFEVLGTVACIWLHLFVAKRYFCIFPQKFRGL